MIDAFGAMNAVGLIAFAVAGSLKAADADLDVFGVAVLGVLTALGGGVTRDVLVGRVPVALRSTTDVGVVLAGVVLALALRTRSSRSLRNHAVPSLADGVGLAAFAATGALVGVDAGLSPFGVVTLAALTGVGGGSLSDLLLGRVPVVLREDFYATPAVVGGLTFRAAVEVDGVAPSTALLPVAGLVFLLRLGALRHGWELPRP